MSCDTQRSGTTPLANQLNTCYAVSMTDEEGAAMQAEYEASQFTRQQLIDALQREYEYLIHDDFDPDVDMSADEHLAYLNSLSIDELIEDTNTDDEYTLDAFMHSYSWLLHLLITHWWVSVALKRYSLFT